MTLMTQKKPNVAQTKLFKRLRKIAQKGRSSLYVDFKIVSAFGLISDSVHLGKKGQSLKSV